MKPKQILINQLRRIERLKRGKFLQDRNNIVEDYGDEDYNSIIDEKIPKIITCYNCDIIDEILEDVEKPKAINIHCTATHQEVTVESIINYWTNHLGWNSYGYNIIFLPNGEITLLSHLDNTTNGVKGYNTDRWNISWLGGVDKKGKIINNITENQIKSISLFINKSFEKLGTLPLKPHNSYPNVAKSCPVIELAELNI